MIPIVSKIVPFTPNCPELRAAFHIHTLSLVEAFGNHTNLILLGHPGFGKTVAIAHLANQIAMMPNPLLAYAHSSPIIILVSI